MGDGSAPAFLFAFKSRAPLLFDYVVSRHLTALWEMIEAYGEYQHFLQSRPGLSERAVSLAAVFFSQYFFITVNSSPWAGVKISSSNFSHSSREIFA